MSSDLQPLHATEPDEGHQDYFIDMIGQLSDKARSIGEVVVAIHLDAIAEARRHALHAIGRSDR
jgi:hypothetical protein